MIEIIPIKERNENQVDTDKIFYIPNGENCNSMAEKYNWAINNIILKKKQKDELICFRHDDTEIRTPMAKKSLSTVSAKQKWWGNIYDMAGITKFICYGAEEAENRIAEMYEFINHEKLKRKPIDF